MIKKVLIVEDHRLMRTALRRLLMTLYDPQPEILEASEGREALKLLKDNPDIDVTILDIQMSGMNRIDTLKAIKMSHHKTGIAMLTQYDHSSLIETADELGANAFLLKNCGPEELKEAMTAAANGEIFVNDLFAPDKKHKRRSITEAKPYSQLAR
jgi:DNA-binding NarL/FixJ family response regulator